MAAKLPKIRDEDREGKVSPKAKHDLPFYLNTWPYYYLHSLGMSLLCLAPW